MTATGKRETSLMVVDDQPANLKLLEQMLRGEGYRVHSFPRGRMALAAAALNPPELILLDINMPEMNGFEVCARLKADAKLRAIPVIFLSALHETSDKLKAFECGGVDYITKPFQFEEVRARVETHCRLHQLQQSLREHNERLEEMIGQRTRELADANGRLQILDRAKSDFLHLISHEFRTPLNGVLGVGELLLEGADAELREMFEQSRRRILTMLDDALVLAEIEVSDEKFAESRISLPAVICRAIGQAAGLAASRQVALRAGPMPAVLVAGREELLTKALQSLVETAVKFANSRETVQVESRVAAEGVHVSIESKGRAVPPQLVPRFFDLLSIGEAITGGGDLGLSPPVAHRILSLLGGSVSVANQDCGIQFSVCMKVADANQKREPDLIELSNSAL